MNQYSSKPPGIPSNGESQADKIFGRLALVVMVIILIGGGLAAIGFFALPVIAFFESIGDWWVIGGLITCVVIFVLASLVYNWLKTPADGNQHWGVSNGQIWDID